MKRWIAPTQLFDGMTLQDGLAVCIENGQITQIAPAPEQAAHIDGILTPGFVDLQVNGGGGVMVNTTPTPDGFRAIAAAHRTYGTVAILPTVITDHPDILDAAANAAIALRDESGQIGLHIEGPHIALARRGTHAARYIRPLDARTLNVVQSLCEAQVATLITLAPEAATLEQIDQLVQMGAIVSLGHTDATAPQIRAAIEAGATLGTHLFNAMSPMTSRAPGAVGALINSDCTLGLICDGHHVADDMIALALRARRKPDRSFLVSDAMATVGGPDHFDLYGQKIHLSDGRLINADGNLAGAHTTMMQGVKRLVERIGLPLEDALRMAITVPATAIAKPHQSTLVGRRIEDAILLSSSLNEATALNRIS